MQNIRFLTDSSVTRLDLKNTGDTAWDNKLECTFWTSSDAQVCVQHYRPRNNISYHPHTHSEYVLIVCLEGELVKTEAGETCAIGPGEMLFTNSGLEHAIHYVNRQSKTGDIVCVAFDGQILSALAGEFQLPAVANGRCPAFTGSLRNDLVNDAALDIARELRRLEPGHKLLVEILALRLLVETLRSWPRDQIKTVTADSVPRLPQRDFIRAYEFMRHCRKGVFRLQHLCHFLGISKERFTRLFLASTNHTPANFYNRLLLERGRELLRDEALSIKEISFQLGFKTTSHFIVAFRREFGAAPQEYRSQNTFHPAIPGSLDPGTRDSKAVLVSA